MQRDKELESVVEPVFSFCEHPDRRRSIVGIEIPLPNKKNQNSGKETHVSRGSFPDHVIKNNRKIKTPRVEDNKTFLSAISNMFPSIDMKESEEWMSGEISDDDVEPYLSLLATIFPDVDVRGEWDPEVDWRFSKQCDDITMRSSPYSERDRMRKASHGKSKNQTETARMEAALTKPWMNQGKINVSTAYKPKSKKVQPINANDGTGEGPGGRPDWYERSKAREVPQEHTGKYKDHLLPRISGIPRGSRLTPERLAALDVGEWLWAEEKEMFFELMLNREGAIAFDWKECSKIHEDVSPPIHIKTIPHEAWQERNFPCPKALFPTVAKMLLERLDRGVLEKCNGPYRNPWFLVAKKTAGAYRLINAAMKMNSVTLRDANMPPSVDEFSEEFAGCHCASLIDFFSGYDQLTLDVRSRDMTAFMTPLGLLRMTTPPQGATNSVAQFVRVVMTILEDLFPKVAMPFLDDIGVKGPYSDYNNELKLPGIRRFVFEHLQNLDATLDRIERAGACIGPKSQFCYNGMGIVGFVCGSGGRAPASAKVVKILEWPTCKDITEAKAFLGICVYYRIWIRDFSTIAEPIYRLFKKDQPWDWGKEQDDSMNTLKVALTTAPLLCKIHYDPNDGWGTIVLAVDASLSGWGGTLGQYDDKGKKRVARYESGVWNKAERSYDATKRECRGVLKCLQKLRYWLYGAHFILETDANVLVAQLNRAATDLPGALVTRWLAWIRLFDFEVKHIKGRKHTAADGLSRRPRAESDDDDGESESDIDEFITAELNCVSIVPVEENWRSKELSGVDAMSSHVIGGFTPDHVINLKIQASTFGAGDIRHLDPLDDSYSEESQRIARYLTTLEKPNDLSRAEFRALVRKAINYSVRDRTLWKNASKSYPPRLVLDAEDQRTAVLTEIHDGTGHAGRESTYHRVADRYYWEGCYEDVRKFVASCKPCQHKSKLRQEEALFPMKAVPLFHSLAIDVVYLPDCYGYKCLVVVRDDFSGWVEAKPMGTPTSAKVAKFIWEDIICRHGVFGKMKVDGGAEFKGAVIKILRKYGIGRVQISAYNSKANGMVEGGHKPIIAALIALTQGGKKKWIEYLAAVLFADRTTVHEPTGHTPFYMVYGREAVLPVETRFPTWRTLGWDEVHDRSKLLELRARQIEMRDEDLEESRLKKNRRRAEGQEYFDATHQIRKSPIKEEDLVLAYDVKLIDQDKSRNTKLLYRWLGPYRIRKADQLKGSYVLEELDGTLVKRTYAGNRLKKFVKRNRYWYSPEDEDDGVVEDVEYEASVDEDEETEATQQERETTQEIERDTGVVVRVPMLSDAEKAKYIRYEEDWAEVDEVESP